MITDVEVNPIVQFVLQSKAIYQNMYNKLISSIEIKNFSGKEKQN